MSGIGNEAVWIGGSELLPEDDPARSGAPVPQADPEQDGTPFVHPHLVAL